MDCQVLAAANTWQSILGCRLVVVGDGDLRRRGVALRLREGRVGHAERDALVREPRSVIVADVRVFLPVQDRSAALVDAEQVARLHLFALLVEDAAPVSDGPAPV